MSRCFPYPPPGYEGKKRDVALIESLKLQREKDKAKKDKKERKKEKRDRKHKEKREKKEKSREYGKSDEKKLISEQRGKDTRNKVSQERVDHKKRKHEETEHVERSSVTEEHGPPAAIQSLYDSSDSTQSSAKRKKQDIGAEAAHNQGSCLRIRLPLLKRKDPELSCNTKQTCYSGKAGHLVTQPETASKHIPSSNADSLLVQTDYSAKEPKNACKLPRYEEQACLSGRADKQAEDTVVQFTTASGSGNHMLESLNLFKNWNPAQLLMDNSEFDNQEWLFESKRRKQVAAEEHKKTENNSGCSHLWPRACYLPGADIYALPFSIPY